MHRIVATAAAVGAALVVVSTASAQAPDTTPPVLNPGTLTPAAAAQRNGDPPNAVPSTSTGNSGWFTQAGPTRLTITATDDVAVTKLQYSLDGGANYIDIPITPGPSVSGFADITQEGNTTVRYRAYDAAGNAARGIQANTTLNQPAAAGATAIRLASTNGRSAGDVLVIDTGAAQETATIASVITPAPASPNPNVTLTAPLANAHAANAAVATTPMYRTTAVPIDTRLPTATFPSTAVVNNRIGHGTAPITPTRTDPTPGSGGTAVRDAWIDGTWTYPLPLDVSQLSLGKHTWTLGLTDAAGNGNKVTLTFLVTTSFADLDALLTRYGTAGTLSSDQVTDLRGKLTAAKNANDAGDKSTAITNLDAFGQSARGVSDSKVRDLLITDSQDVTRQVRGVADAPAPSDLGVTSQAYPGQPRHLYVPPAMPTHNPNAKYKVLVISQRSDGFRHPAIEDAEVLLQQMGAKYGFDVDLWDYAYPNQSLPDTPFTSAANLAQYKVIIGNSSVGNNTFRTNYTMKDGTVVNEQAAFQQYIENGGGYVAIHGADDSMHAWQWYKDMLGGLFVSHPANASGFGTDCGSCYWAEVVTEDPSHPSTDASGKPTRVAVPDELYHYDRKPRGFVHPLMLLNEDTYKTAIGVTGTTGSNPALEGPDHPISFCSNYDGGRVFAQVLGHNWELFHEDRYPWFVQGIYHGILTAGGMEYANCVTHAEVKTLLTKLQTAGGITADAATQGNALVDSAYTKYAALTKSGYSASLSDIDALRALAQNPASGDAASRAQVLFKAQELKNWMLTLLGSKDVGGNVGGSVPATLSLGLGPAASFGAFTPGVAKTYTASTTASVISTAGDSVLSVADPSNTATGRLVNGSFALPAPVQAAATSAVGAGAALANVGGSSSPTGLLTYSGPVSNDAATLNFSQAIAANDALRTGGYNKTLTFTLSTTTP